MQNGKRTTRSFLNGHWFPFMFIDAMVACLVLVIPVIAQTNTSLDNLSISNQFLVQGLNSSKTDESEIKRVVSKDLFSVAGTGTIPKVYQVIVVDSYAVADWILGESGNSAFLIKKQGKWSLAASDGGMLSSNELSKRFGVPKNTAQKLLELRLKCIRSRKACEEK